MTLLLLLTCALALSYACALFAESLGNNGGPSAKNCG
jgi:hypothetical protein